MLTVGAVSASPIPGSVTEEREAALSPAGYDAYRWMAANLPADARILTNAYTDGAVAAVAKRVGIVDGRAVYLEDPTFLAESTALVLGARVVFGMPAAPGAEFVPRSGGRDPPAGRDGRPKTAPIWAGTCCSIRTSAAIRVRPPVPLAVRFDDDRLQLYEVVRVRGLDG